MIWLPSADQPLVFAPAGELLARAAAARPDLAPTSWALDLTDAGGGAGAWQASVRQLASVRGAAVRVPADGDRPRQADARRRRRPLGAARARAAASSCSPAAAQTRRFPYWFRVSVPRLGSEGHTLLRRPGVYRGNTRGRPARVSSYRYPSAPGRARRDAAARRPRAGLPLRHPRPGRERRRRRRLRGAGLARLAAPRARGQRGPARRLHRPAAAAEPVPAELLRPDPGGRRLPPRAGRLRPRLRHHQPSRGRAASPSASGSTTRARPPSGC